MTYLRLTGGFALAISCAVYAALDGHANGVPLQGETISRATSAQTPPVQKPPVPVPPVQTPSVQTPPVQKPPVQTPSVQTPPAQKPPVQTPPAQTPPVPTPQPAAPAAVVAFTGGRIIDGTGKLAVDNGTILVRGGKIEAVGPAASVTVPADAKRVDLTGKYVMRGLVNAHGHVGDTMGLEADPKFHTMENLERQLALYARYGVTTVFSLGGDSEYGFRLRDQGDSPTLARARIVPAGPVVQTGNPAAARLMTDAIADMKSTLLKIRVDDMLGTQPKMPASVFQSIIEQAHRRKLKVAVHIYYLDDAKEVLKAGADFIAHSVRDKDVDAELITLLKARDVCVSPTLMREVSTFVYETTPAFFKDPFFLKGVDPAVVKALQDPAKQKTYREDKAAQQYKTALEVATRNLKKLSDAGITIAMGTDTGPTARFQGYFEHLELERMVGAGLTPAQVIRAATGDAAKCFGMSGTIGNLQPGAWADLLVLTANPLENITNTRKIDSVWISGNRIADK